MVIKTSISTLSLTLFTTLLLTATASNTFNYGEDYANTLDTILCQNVHPSQHMIVDIRTSIDRGADLIDGKWVKDFDTCISQCCGMEGCDLALFKTDGVSSSGKNCYYIDCGDSPSNCVLVEHDGFSSVRIGDRQKEHTDKEPLTTHTTSPSQPTTPSESTSPPSIATPPHTDAKTDATSNSDVTTVPTSASTESDSDSIPVSSPIPVSDSNPNKGNQGPTSKIEPPKPNPGSNGKPDVSGVTPKSGPVVIIEGDIPVISSPDCSKGGCDSGSGLIAVAVVGVICFVVILIVVVVLLKKVFTDQRRKRFRNVDYLINGMYT